MIGILVYFSRDTARSDPRNVNKETQRHHFVDLRSDCGANRHPSSRPEYLLHSLDSDGQMIGIARERQKPVFRLERGGLIVDRLHLDRPKGDLAGNAQAAVEGVQEKVLAQTLAALGLVDG